MELIPALTSGIDPQRPSLFELLSEQQLSALIPPSLRYLLALATHRQPRYLLRILNSFDELYALLSLVIERYYIIHYGGSFVENFYQLKRERVLRTPSGNLPRAALVVPDRVRELTKIKGSSIWKNLAILVGIPYLKRKLDEEHDINAPQVLILGPRYNRDALPPNPTLKQRIQYYWKYFLRNVYPYVNSAYYFSILAFNIAYLFDNTHYSSPFLWMIGTRIRRMGPADYRAIAQAAEQASNSPPSSARKGPQSRLSIFNPVAMATIILPRLLSGLKILLPASIFALKFLEWWHASDFANQLSKKATEGISLPPPIISEEKTSFQRMAPNTVPAYSHPDRLGKAKSRNSVALSSSSSTPQAVTYTSEDDATRSQQTRLPPYFPPLSPQTRLPILTLPPLTANLSQMSLSPSMLCPICAHPIQTPTAAQTGYVFCYTCIYKWVDGSHDMQAEFMAGGVGWRPYGKVHGVDADGEKIKMRQRDSEDLPEDEDGEMNGWAWDSGEGREEIGGRIGERKSRRGDWEDGRGRCAVTGRRVLGGTEGLRRVVV
ncbi:ubiquitin-protein ligase peroxin 12 [Agyrium rufum]|nr:ubiquitin-protein ligase peroxin 12 [Agyrium rufum]